MNHAPLPVFLLLAIALGCDENNSSKYSSYEPSARPELNPEPAGTNPPGAFSNDINATAGFSTQIPAQKKPVEAPPKPVISPVAVGTPTVNVPKTVVETPFQPEPKYASLAAAELQMLADKGDAQACWMLGLRFELGNGVATNAVTAYQWVALAAARSGGVHRSLMQKDEDRLASRLTAEQIKQARKPALDFVLKRTEARKVAADKGDVEAMFALGMQLFLGEGIAVDKTKAAARLSQAAEHGHAGAAALLGRMYLNGDTVTKDLELGYRLLEHAATHGNALARADIAEAPKSMTPAQLAEASETARALLAKKVALLEAATAKADSAAKFKLGLMFYLGTEIPKDLPSAAGWFEKAGEQGHAEAPALLAGMFFSGEGVKKSFAETYKWHGIAKARGNPTATANQNEVVKLLTAEEKTATDKEIAAWLAAHPKQK